MVPKEAPDGDFRAAVDRLVESASSTVDRLEGQVIEGVAPKDDAVQAISDASRRMLEVFSSGRMRVMQAAPTAHAGAEAGANS